MNVKVIATSFATERQVRLHLERKLDYPDHYQNIQVPEDVVDMLDTIVNIEKEQDPGVPMDTVIVVSNPIEYGLRYLRGVEGTKTPRGEIKLLEYNGPGWSFGAFNHAFETFRRKYKYWLFTEDDILVGGESYYKRLIERFEEKPDTGYVAMVKVCKHTYGTHAGGAIGLTSRDILSKVYKRFGFLPHYQKPDKKDDPFLNRRHEIITSGEVPFTNSLYGMGFDLVEFNNPNEWDFKKNLCVPYYNYIYGI